MENQNYAFEDFTTHEITKYFSEIQIPIQISDLLKPTPAFIQSFLENILTIFCNFKIPDDIFENENAESIYIFLLYKNISSFMQSLYFKINFKDIINPESKRVITIFSRLMNYSMFRDTKRQLYESIIKNIKEKELLKNNIEDKIKKAIQDFETKEEIYKKEKEENNKLENEILNIEKEMNEEYKVYRSMVTALEKEKKENEELCDLESSNQLFLVNAKQECNYLKSQIVNDPAKLVELVREMKEMVQKEKETLNLLEVKKIEKEKNINYFDDLMESIKEKIKLSVELEKRRNEQSELIAKINSFSNEINILNMNFSNLERKENNLNKQINIMENKINALLELNKKEMEDANSKMNFLREKLLCVQTEIQKTNLKYEECCKTIRDIENEIKLILGEHANFVEEKKNLLKEIQKNIEKYISEFL